MQCLGVVVGSDFYGRVPPGFIPVGQFPDPE